MLTTGLKGTAIIKDDNKTLDQIVLARLIRLNATIQGVVFGLVIGLGIFIATNWLLLTAGDVKGPHGEVVVGPHLALLGQFFIGYQVSFVGSLIGFVYGFVTGFLIGYFVARLYNWLVDLRESKLRGKT